MKFQALFNLSRGKIINGNGGCQGGKVKIVKFVLFAPVMTFSGMSSSQIIFCQKTPEHSDFYL